MDYTSHPGPAALVQRSPHFGMAGRIFSLTNPQLLRV